MIKTSKSKCDKVYEMHSMNQHNFETVHEYIEKIIPSLEKPACGKIHHPYLNIGIGQHYTGIIFVWDHHHMAMRAAYNGKPEYFRMLIDNLIEYQTGDGYIPNCLSKDGPCDFYPRFHAQPFLMQSALMYLDQTGDENWCRNIFEKLKKYLSYYENSCGAPYGLFRWPEAWMSGYDNDVVTTFFQPDTVISVDLNAWLYLEYLAASKIAARLDIPGDSDLKVKAEKLKNTINEILWYDEVDSYSAFNLVTQRHLFHYEDAYLDKSIGYYAFQSCSNLIPLYAGIADENRAKRMIQRYVISENHFLSQYGIRSLSRSSEYFNNAIWGNPPRFGSHLRLTTSNWQGPIWIPMNYFMFHALRQYGFISNAENLADRIIDLLANSLQKIGSFTENFDSETGNPLYAHEFCSWNILADIMHKEINEKRWIMSPVLGIGVISR